MAADWQVETQDGTVLAGRCWDLEAPRALVYVAHGLAEHVARYDRFADALNASGFAVAGHDHRGHGQTVRSPGDLGHFADSDGFNRMADDVFAGAMAWRDRHPGTPFVLFGHSMGSFLVQHLLPRAAGCFDMAILSGSNGKPPPLASVGRVVARIEKLRLGARGRSQLMHGLAFDANNKPFEPAPTKQEWLSRDRAEVDAYVADPLCGFVATTASWIALLDALPALTAPAHLTAIPAALPVLLMAGDQDPVGDRGAGVKRLAESYLGCGMTDVTTVLYPGARHEILNETNRDEITADIIAWVDGRLGAA